MQSAVNNDRDQLIVVKADYKGEEHFRRPLRLHQNPFWLRQCLSLAHVFFFIRNLHSIWCWSSSGGQVAVYFGSGWSKNLDLCCLRLSVFCDTSTGMRSALLQSSSSGSPVLTASAVILGFANLVFLFLITLSAVSSPYPVPQNLYTQSSPGFAWFSAYNILKDWLINRKQHIACFFYIFFVVLCMLVSFYVAYLRQFPSSYSKVRGFPSYLGIPCCCYFSVLSQRRGLASIYTAINNSLPRVYDY